MRANFPSATSCVGPSALLDLLRAALSLDVYDLNYNLSSPEMERHIRSSKIDKPHTGLLWRLGAFVVHGLGALVHHREAATSSTSPDRPVVFFAATRNQELALEDIHGATESSCFFGIGSYGQEACSLVLSHFVSILYVPLLVAGYLKARGYTRRSYRWALDSYLLTYGYYVSWRRRLRKLAASAVIVSNDHMVWTRVLTQAAKDEHIPTVYLQHASVVEYFPRLSFDYAFLDGYDAMEKYDRDDVTGTRVYLVGMAKADAYLPLKNRNCAVATVGICTGHWIRVADVEEVVRAIRREQPNLNVIVRPHPGDNREQLWTDLADEHACTYSDSVVETSFEFLTRVDAVIASDSSILLEAALMDVYPLYYDFPHRKLDLYGYLRNGLVEYFATPSALCARLTVLSSCKPHVVERAKHYCATVGTAHEGRTRQLISSLITEIRSGSMPPSSAMWDRVAGTTLQAYEPADL